MKHLLLISLLIPFLGTGQQGDEAKIAELNKQWIAAYATRDTSVLKAVLAHDFVMVSPKGIKLSKQNVIDNVGNPNIETKAFIDSVSVRLFGNTALVIAYTSFTIKTKDGINKGTNCYSDLYIKRNDKWQAVSAHVTLLSYQ